MSMTRDMMNPVLDADTIASRELLRFLVCREIFCPVNGHVMDVKDAVLIEGTAPGGFDTFKPRVFSPTGWAEVKDLITGKLDEMGVVLTITEGAE